MVHTRLSVIDVNSSSDQPLVSSCNNYTIVFNGEIYNYEELRNHVINLSDYKFKTNSDTEVILALYKLYGAKMVSMLRGMFSFFIWDTISNTAFVARDPYGIKPLYYTFYKNNIFFSSTLYSLAHSLGLTPSVSSSARISLQVFGHIVSPFCWFSQFHEFPPGSYSFVNSSSHVKPIQYASVSVYLDLKLPIFLMHNF